MARGFDLTSRDGKEITDVRSWGRHAKPASKTSQPSRSKASTTRAMPDWRDASSSTPVAV